MLSEESKIARKHDPTDALRELNEVVYGGQSDNGAEMHAKIREVCQKYYPAPSEYQIFYGELHGHTNLSDGKPNIDDYFTSIRDRANLDFAALADHDHGGVANSELWGEKWELIKQTVKKYYEPHKFTTILAFEKKGNPWYSNSVFYYDNHDAEILRGEVDGEMTRAELRSYLKRDDLIIVPHDTNVFSAGTDFSSLELEDMTPLIQVHSRYNCCERYDPVFLCNSDFEGGHWQDALNKGAKMGCIACSDDHNLCNGLEMPAKAFPWKYPGITGVLAKENTLPAIFEALKARRCYGFMGGRIGLDFRINGHYMGEEIAVEGDRNVYYKIMPDAPIDRVTLVKNGRDYIVFKGTAEQVIFDHRAEKETDYYYIRVVLADGRMAWSSPIWVSSK